MLAVLLEKNHLNLLSGVEHFDKSAMKHATTAEKIVLPDVKGIWVVFFWKTVTNQFVLLFSVIEQEKGQRQLISGIENFDTSKLKHAETCEKNPLPTKDVIDQEKSA